MTNQNYAAAAVIAAILNLLAIVFFPSERWLVTGTGAVMMYFFFMYIYRL